MKSKNPELKILRKIKDGLTTVLGHKKLAVTNQHALDELTTVLTLVEGLAANKVFVAAQRPLWTRLTQQIESGRHLGEKARLILEKSNQNDFYEIDDLATAAQREFTAATQTVTKIITKVKAPTLGKSPE